MPVTTAQKEHRKARRMWLKALRSGKFKWGKHKLQPADGKFCCLGVACEVAIKEGVIEAYDPDTVVLPVPVRLWLGISNGEGRFISSKNHMEHLSVINDGAKRNPFKKIANIIESEPEGLFID